jgi:hypothetical protein
VVVIGLVTLLLEPKKLETKEEEQIRVWDQSSPVSHLRRVLPSSPMLSRRGLFCTALLHCANSAGSATLNNRTALRPRYRTRQARQRLRGRAEEGSDGAGGAPLQPAAAALSACAPALAPRPRPPRGSAGTHLRWKVLQFVEFVRLLVVNF